MGERLISEGKNRFASGFKMGFEGLLKIVAVDSQIKMDFIPLEICVSAAILSALIKDEFSRLVSAFSGYL